MLTVRSALGRTRLAEELGQAIPLFAGGALAMLLMAGLVIDGGNLFQNRQSLQNAADAAAIAAALEIAEGNCSSGASTACANLAGQYAGLNNANGSSGTSTESTALPDCSTLVQAVPVSDTQPPISSNAPGCYVYPYNEDKKTIEVWLTRRSSNFFGGLLGITNSAESARAVATARPSDNNNNLGIYIYSSGDVTLKGGPPIQEPVVAQGNLNIQGTASVDAIARLVAVGLGGTGGTVTNTGSGTLGDGPLTSLTADLAPGTTASMSVGSTLNFQTPGTVFVTTPGSCPANLDGTCNEWIDYAKPQSGTLTTLLRGYGGYDALVAGQHYSGDSVDPRLADLWDPNCGSWCNAPLSWMFVKNPVHPYAYSFPPPTFNINTAYADAKLGPGKPCAIGSGLPANFFGSGSGGPQDPTPSNLTTNLTPNSGYICKTTGGEISWGGTANGGFTFGSENVPKGELLVTGTIFLNASLSLTNNATYQTGSAGAAIWTTGGWTLSGNYLRANCGTVLSPSPCGIPGITSAPYWDPSKNLLGIVAHKVDAASSNCISFGGNATTAFQGAMYADGNCGSNASAIDLGGNAAFQGLMDGASVTVHGTSVSPSPGISSLPQDFPVPPTVSLVG